MFVHLQETYTQHRPELLEHFAQASAAIRTNRSLYLLEVPLGAKVLFRIDGLVVQLKPVVYDLLQAIGTSSPQEAVTTCSACYGEEEIEGALHAIVDLADSPAVMTEPAPLKRPDPARHEPTGILIMVTQTCNLACTYCYAGGGSYGSPTKLMPEADALRAVDLMLERAPHKRRFTITIFGGEPLLNFPLIRRIVEYCTQIGVSRGIRFDYSMTTNGTIVTDEIIEFLKGHRFTLMVSYDGPSQDVHRPFVGGGPSDSIVRRNLHRLADAGVPFQLRATIIKQFAKRETVEQLVQIGRSLGDKKVAMSSVSATKNAIFPANEDLALEPEDGEQLQTAFREVTEKNLEAAKAGRSEGSVLDTSSYIVRALAEGRAAGLGRCGAGLGMTAASTDGNLYPCHRFVGMEEYSLGTSQSGVVPEKVRRFFETADAANKEKCDVCFARQICGGFCFYNISDGKGGFLPPDERECEHFRENIRFAITTLLRLQELPPDAAAQYMKNT